MIIIIMSDIHWLQASIPVKSGGLGIRRVVSLAFLAFLASAVATFNLRSAILSRGIQMSTRRLNWLVLFRAHSQPPQHSWATFKPSKELKMPRWWCVTVKPCWTTLRRYLQSKTARRESRPR